MNIASFLPTFLKNNYPNITSFQVGCLFACYPLAYLCFCPVVGNYVGLFGLKTSMIFGLTLMSVSTVVFGLASYSSNATVFFLISGSARILQAFGDSTVCVSIPIIINS